MVSLNYMLVISLATLNTGLHEDMRVGLLADETDYGSKPLRNHLKRMYSTLLFNLPC